MSSEAVGSYAPALVNEILREKMLRPTHFMFLLSPYIYQFPSFLVKRMISNAKCDNIECSVGGLLFFMDWVRLRTVDFHS